MVPEELAVGTVVAVATADHSRCYEGREGVVIACLCGYRHPGIAIVKPFGTKSTYRFSVDQLEVKS